MRSTEYRKCGYDHRPNSAVLLAAPQPRHFQIGVTLFAVISMLISFVLSSLALSRNVAQR